MKHLGDITKIDGHKVPLVDIVTGGSPCQDLSIAGKREGLSGARSGLFMEQIRIIKEMRDEYRKLHTGSIIDLRCIQPRFMVWENVPGAFSSNNGEDFRAVLEETAKVADENAIIPRFEGGRWPTSGCILADGWSIAWRVHDAQFWGVPQRRKRIALVADFGDTTAPEILFERKGLSGDIEQSGKTGKGVAGDFETDPNKAISFQERAGCEGGVKEYSYKENELEHSQPSTINTYCIGGGMPNDAAQPDRELSKTLNCMVDTMKILTEGFDCYNQQTTGEVSKSLSSIATDSDHIPCVYGIDRASFNQGKNAQYNFSVEEEKAQTIVAKGPGGVLAKQ